MRSEIILRITGLLARAYRPIFNSLDSRIQTLTIAIATTTGGENRLVWALSDFADIEEEERLPVSVLESGKWHTKLSELQLTTTDSCLFSEPWERVDFFKFQNLISEDTFYPQSIKPCLSVDAVAGDSNERPHRELKGAWLRGEPSTRPNEGPVSRTQDLSCLYLDAVEGSVDAYLVANIKLRNLLGQTGAEDNATLLTTTWQFVISLGSIENVDLAQIWESESGKLYLRDIYNGFYGAGYSFAGHVKKSKKPFLLEEVATDLWELPASTERNAVAFQIATLDAPSPLQSILSKRKLDVGPFEFPLDIVYGNSGALGGFSLTKAENDEGTLRLRLIALRERKDGDREQVAFDVPKDRVFYIQEQDFGSEAIGRPYRPRGKDRNIFIPWRVFIVHPKPYKSGQYLASWWTTNIACPVTSQLRGVKDGSPLSFVPTLEAAPGGATPWMLALAVRDHISNTAWWDPRGNSQSLIPDFDYTQPLVQPAKVHTGETLKLRFEGAATFDDRLAVFHAELSHSSHIVTNAVNNDWAFAIAAVATDGPIVAFGLTLISSTEAPPQERIAVGALDLTLTEPEGDFPFHIRLFGAIRSEASIDGNCGSEAPVMRLEASLPAQVAAGAVDRLTREDVADVDRELELSGGLEGRELDAAFELDRPLVIDLSETKDRTLFVLRVGEAVADGQSHNLQLGLFRIGAEQGQPTQQRIMVLDRTPFSVYLARSPTLASLADATTNEVAVWTASGEGGAHWRIAESDVGLEIILPPQGMGEEMVRGKELPPNKPLEFRFTPHARLILDPSFEDRRYGETPWNVRRLFGYAGQRTPGAWLRGFDLELLYGLAGEARGLEGVLVAEIETRLGRPAGRQPDKLPWQAEEGQEALWQRYRQAWGKIRSQLASRLAVLETYRSDGGEALISEGLTWYQRDSAKLRFPFIDTDYVEVASARPELARSFFGAASPALPPAKDEAAKGDKPGTNTEADEKPDAATNPTQQEERLAGGWTWGFQSLNVLEAVVRDSRSTSAFISGLKFSALGGWGYQKASFDEGRSSIYANTSAGRTHFYSLERIGRIGVFWNRAKHVIIYERTVVPSDQFENDQDPHLGRPLVRKVKEYIEILEPERAFPDSNTPKALRGCVLGLHFKSVKIFVDSNWGEDVRKEGWKVPLWNPLLGQQEPVVYPRPQIAFRLAADPQGDIQSVSAFCNTPELIFFYTDTVTGTGADPDRWAPVLGVDYGIDHGLAAETVQAALVNMPSQLTEQLPPESAVAPGLHDFTYGLEPPERPINLIADRAEGSMNASLRNITLMRAVKVLKSSDSGSTLLEDASAEYTKARTLEQRLKTFAVKGKELSAAKQEAKERIKQAVELRNEYKGFAESVSRLTSSDVCESAKRAAEAAFDRWLELAGNVFDKTATEIVERIKIVETHLEQHLDTANRQPREEITKLKAAIDELTRNLKEVLQKTSASVLGTQNSALAGLNSFEAELQLVVASAEDLLTEVIARIENLAPTATDTVTLEDWLARAAETRSQVRSGLQRLLEMLEKAERTVNSRGDRLGKLGDLPLFQLRLTRAAISAEVKRLDSLFEEVLAHRSAIDTADALVQQARRIVGTIKEKISEGIALVEKKLQSFTQEVQTQVDDFSIELKGINPVLEALDDTLKKILDKQLTTLEDELKKERAVVNDIRQKLGHGYFSQPVGDTLALVRKTLVEEALSKRDKVVGTVFKVCNTLSGSVKNWVAVGEYLSNLPQIMDSTSDIEELRRELEATANHLVGEVTAVYEEAKQAMEASPAVAALQQADRGVRLVRAFGDPPKVPKLDFNRAATAFIFGDPKGAIDMTPTTAWFDGVGNDLKALGIRLPTDKVLERLLPPDDLSKLDLGKLLPDFAGLKLDRLFPNLKVPNGASDGVRITHGLDKQRQRAWAEAEVDLQLMKQAEMFAFGPLTLTLHKAHFEAFARLEAGERGSIERLTKASLSGDWQFDFGGQTLVTFKQTTLMLDDGGRTRFDLSPERMELAPALRYLTDLARQVQYDEGGFVFQLLERDGVPYGAEAFFEIALPPLQYGTTGLIGATIGAGLRLVADPDFAIALHMHVSRKDAPFVFSVFILGGAGYVEASALYLPFQDSLTADVSIGLAASAALGFAFGPVSGQVMVSLGVSVEFHRRPGQNQGGLNIGLTLLVLGRVDVMSIVTVHLSLLLEATYHESGQITARGTLNISIRISRFFKISVSTTVAYNFKTGKAINQSSTNVQSHPALDGARKLARAAA